MGGGTPKERVRELLDSSGLTQEKFCEKAGINRYALNLVLSGRREVSRNMALKLERNFDVSTDWILYGDELSKVYPCSDEMIVYLKKHPEVRCMVCEKMKSSGKD